MHVRKGASMQALPYSCMCVARIQNPMIRTSVLHEHRMLGICHVRTT